MKIVKKSLENKILSPHIIEAILKLNFNNDYRRNTENALKIKERDLEIAFDNSEIYIISRLYAEILKSNKFDEAEAFILTLSILLISKITDTDVSVILEEVGIN